MVNSSNIFSLRKYVYILNWRFHLVAEKAPRKRPLPRKRNEYSRRNAAFEARSNDAYRSEGTCPSKATSTHLEHSESCSQSSEIHLFSPHKWIDFFHKSHSLHLANCCSMSSSRMRDRILLIGSCMTVIKKRKPQRTKRNVCMLIFCESFLWMENFLVHLDFALKRLIKKWKNLR